MSAGPKSSARPATLLLSRSDVAAVMDADSCMTAVEEAFRAHAEGRARGPASLGVLTEDGSFHVKAAGLSSYFAAKTNANFPDNPARHGLPTIQGVVLLCDDQTGRLLAVMDSMEITVLRTAAASALAARYLARPESRVATLCGCGAQAAAQIRALSRVLPLKRVLAFDLDPRRIDTLTETLARDTAVAVETGGDLAAALRASDIAVTCTPSHIPFLKRDDIRPGTFIAAVGADNPLKSEIEPDLMAAATVVVDILDQCAAAGDLHHAIEACVMTRADVHAELADLVTGRKSGRQRADEITLFDSSGTALQDAAAARLAYEHALASGRGQPLDFSA
jgi:ornithine cyclodeaminase/alanine dehydrogenase-like protein (mu-crystallin family)